MIKRYTLALLFIGIPALGLGADNLIFPHHVEYVYVDEVRNLHGFSPFEDFYPDINKLPPKYLKATLRTEQPYYEVLDGSTIPEGHYFYSRWHDRNAYAERTFKGSVRLDKYGAKEFADARSERRTEWSGSGASCGGQNSGQTVNTNAINLGHAISSDATPTQAKFTNTTASLAQVSPTQRTFGGSEPGTYWHYLWTPCTSGSYPSSSERQDGIATESVDRLNTDTVVLHSNRGSPFSGSVPTGYSYVSWYPRKGLSKFPISIDTRKIEYKAAFRDLCNGSYLVRIALATREGNSGAFDDTRIEYQYVKVENGTGFIEGEVEASHVNEWVQIRSIAIENSGPDCSSCEDGGTDEIGSIRWSRSMGFMPGGAAAGLLMIREESFEGFALTPGVLKVAAPAIANDHFKVKRQDEDNSIRQVQTGSLVFDVAFAIGDPSAPEDNVLEVLAYRATDVVDSPVFDYKVPIAPPIYSYRLFHPSGDESSLAIEKFADQSMPPVESSIYSFDSATDTWSLLEENARLTTKKYVSLVDGTRESRTRVYDVRTSQQELVKDVTQIERPFAVGGTQIWLVVGETMHSPEGDLSTLWEYDATGRQILRRDYHDRWEITQYPSNSEIRHYEPFANGSASALSSDSRRTNSRVSHMFSVDGDNKKDRITFTAKYAKGTLLSQDIAVLYTKSASLNGVSMNLERRARSLVLLDEYAVLGDDIEEWESTRYYVRSGLFRGRLGGRFNKDGTAELISYSFDAETSSTTVVAMRGVPTADSSAMISGTKSTKVYHAMGELASETVVDVESGLLVDSMEVLEFDERGRPLVVAFLDGTVETRSWSDCCDRLESMTSRDGIVTTYTYDALGNMSSETANGITLNFDYDALGRLLTAKRIGSDGSEIVLSSSTYDMFGRIVESRDARDRLTTIRYEYLGNGQVLTETVLPDGATSLQTSVRDGSVVLVRGTAEHPEARATSIVTDSHDGRSLKAVKTVVSKLDTDGTPLPQVVAYYEDAFGRQYKVETPSPDGIGSVSSLTYYDNYDRVAREVDPDGVTTLYGYDSRGRLEFETIDGNGNGHIDLEGADNVTRFQSAYAEKRGVVVNELITSIYGVEGSSEPTVVSVVDESVDGLQVWSADRGLVTRRATERGATPGLVVRTTEFPDGKENREVYDHARLVSEALSHPELGDLSLATYTYDAHGRVESATDGRSGTTNFGYYADDQIHWMTSPDPDPDASGTGADRQTTTFLYDAAGRLSETHLPDGGVQYVERLPGGRVARQWGTRINPVAYEYDAQGRVTALRTWQDYEEGTGAAITGFNYHPGTGLLAARIDAAGQQQRYDYTPGGRLARKELARGVTADYEYDSRGLVVGIDYSDDTPDVTLTRDRLGRISGASDGAGTVEYGFDADGALETETYVGGVLAGHAIERGYDSQNRPSTLSIPTLGYDVGYSYDKASRLATVSSGLERVVYGYHPLSDHVQSLAVESAGHLRIVRESALDFLNRARSTRATLPATGEVATRAYAYNDANQRTLATMTDGSYWSYSYDALGQVESADKRLSNDAPVLGHGFGFQYDDIGNRVASTFNGRQSTLVPNALNQYASVSSPGAIDVLLEAEPDAVVLVEGEEVESQGRLRFAQLDYDNSSSPLWVGVTTLAAAAGGETYGRDTRGVFVPQAQVTLGYDADGNLREDGRWRYAWDAENRLVAMETAEGAWLAGVPRERLVFDYDFRGRRIRKAALDWDATISGFRARATTRYLYDGWNVVAELGDEGGDAVAAAYVWGLDLSGSLQGAGGVGGLALLRKGEETFSPVMDASGNVVALVDLESGARVATFDYGPFGEIVREEYASSGYRQILGGTGFRFSTKLQDSETGLLYYGYRYYGSKAGRWLSRDPIGEQGGLNLYGMVGNDSVNFVDRLGLDALPLPSPTRPPNNLIPFPKQPAPNPGPGLLGRAGYIGAAGYVGYQAGKGYDQILSPIGIPSVGEWWGQQIFDIWNNSQPKYPWVTPPPGYSPKLNNDRGVDPIATPDHGTNPGKDDCGKCKPCPPNTWWWAKNAKPGEHGSLNGYHVNYYIWSQASDCNCYFTRRGASSPQDIDPRFFNRPNVQIPGVF